MSCARILVVDDEADILDLLSELLGESGYDVVRASDGREAMRALFQAQPDLVLLDVAMPELDGWQTLERIRDASDLPVLMLTARAGEDDKVRGLRAGANDYVTKPFSTRELLARIDALLRAHKGSGQPTETYADDFLTVDFADRAVAVEGSHVTLTPPRVQALVGVRPQREQNAQRRRASRPRVGRSGRGQARIGQALRELSQTKALRGRPCRRSHRDGPGVRLPLPRAQASGGRLGGFRFSGARGRPAGACAAPRAETAS